MKPIILFIIFISIMLSGCRRYCWTCTKYSVSANHIDTTLVGGQMVFDTSARQYVQIPNSSFGSCLPTPPNVNAQPPLFSLSPDTMTSCMSDAPR